MMRDLLRNRGWRTGPDDRAEEPGIIPDMGSALRE